MLVYTIAVEAATTIDKAPNAHHAAQTSCSGKVFWPWCVSISTVSVAGVNTFWVKTEVYSSPCTPYELIVVYDKNFWAAGFKHVEPKSFLREV